MNHACPNYECSLGRVPDRTSLNGFLRCPICAGKGFVVSSLPIPEPDKMFSSDFGITKPKRWRDLPFISGRKLTGTIQGLPISGKGIATDGVLVIIEMANGEQFTGHLQSFIRDKVEKSNRAKGEKVDVNEGLWD